MPFALTRIDVFRCYRLQILSTDFASVPILFPVENELDEEEESGLLKCRISR